MTMKPTMPHQVRLRWPNAWVGSSRESLGETGGQAHVITGSSHGPELFGQNQAISAARPGTARTAPPTG